MNRKIMILMVAVVATVLPAVAVADVMITGSISVHGSQAPDMVYLAEGPNYATASSSNLLTFTNGSGSGSPAATIGSLGIEGMADANVTMLNVLYLNYSVSTSGTLWINVTGTDFPSGAYAALSTSTLTSVSSAGTMSYPLSGINGHNGPISVSTGHGSYYVSFFLPASTEYSSANMEISVTFIPS